MSLRVALGAGVVLVAAGAALLAREISLASRAVRTAEVQAKALSAGAGDPGAVALALGRTTGHLRSAHVAALSAAVLGGVAAVLYFRVLARMASERIAASRRLHAEEARRIANAERARVLQSVTRLTEVFGETRDVESVLGEAVRAVQEFLGIENVILEIYGSEESRFRRHMAEGTAQDVDLGDEVYEDVLGRGRGRLANRLGESREFEALAARGFHAMLVTPLESSRSSGAKEPVGLIAVLSDRERDFSTQEMSLLAIFARQASLIIENAQLYHRTRLMAIHDGLTNLYNHRRFREVLDEVLTDASARGRLIGLVMGDIDDFKHYNDTHGHLQGDMVLRTVGEILRTNVRGVDTVARYGGEEFVIILPDTDLHGGLVVTDSLRSRIERHAFPGGGSQPGGALTITFGVAAYPADGRTAEELIDAADRALYAGKRAGKNRTVAAARLGVESTTREEEAR